ncbi:MULTISPECIES: bifunctional 2-polyprenyl-6-hydroxyphenol methylase/3-demethylubiquinol 3-O-methyltransferase UbiG [Legionella]|uniref:Ubiquinone biosynthesis O-methyltransferase n=1 Tax=Legionella drozanskii LLAP-1 TaxID=1212489 RepID=A0A0W0TBU9_9GAMM|nr:MULTISPECIES: bifunctional 2-polyprenyl-6-hydroxyphenol methylase/3-demethylubiquinol 3-O-methyltransferase UbiG [Legionella]KTC93051.1 3-demethylubiquinone-9 3-methyltransferase [Legionella drozanskii LLAP-1]PJE11955.1 MAG: bifunctional 2-polyprenyl-6-hydroxyphenol methylase/3-demethylubiquinol 3-O-methyltransferase UbiG [Legionella sp.]
MNKSTVDPQEIAKFAQHASDWWDKEGPLKTLHDINPARLDFIQNHLELAQQTVLDVGCGGGILCEGMALKKAQVTGLDVEIDALEAAKAHAALSTLTINYVCSPVEDYEERSAFDVVTCMEMLEHVNNPQLVINHCARLLKPGGYLFLSTINRTLKAYATAIVAAEYVLGILPRQTHDFAKFIKPSELAAMIREAGLEFREIAGMAYNPLSRSARLQESVDVNYLLSCFKPS